MENNVEPKKKSKKKLIVIISILLIMAIIIGALAVGGYYFLESEKNKIQEIKNSQEQALCEMSENISYGYEITYEDLLIKLVDTSKLKENTNITIKINDKELIEGEKFIFNELGTYTINTSLEYTYIYPIIKSKSELIENEKSIEIKIEDTEKPVITGVSNKEITVGDTIDLSSGITATDNIDGNLQVTIDGTVDNTKAGEYSIKVIATDKSGNSETATFTVTVKEKPKPKVSVSSQTNKKETGKTGNSATNSNTSNSVVEKRTFTTEELKAEANTAKSTYRSQINAVLNCTNQYRQEKGLPNLVLDETLTTAACMRAVEMAYSGVLAHTRPDGRDFDTVLEEVNVFPYAWGENIAWGQATPEKAAEWWRNSPGHYANMVREFFGKIGIGAFKLNGRFYWVQLFTN